MASADLSVTKTGSPDPAGIGQPIIYNIEISNSGPDDASSVILEDKFLTGVCLTEITVEQGSYCYENGTITWNAGTLQAGDTRTMTVTVIPQTAGTIGNTANVYLESEEDEDPNPDNNSVTLEVTVTPAVDLVLLKKSCPLEATIGETITYFITVLNNGPSIANNVKATDSFPANVVVESATSDKGICQFTINNVSCELASLEANDRWDIKIEVTPAAEGTIINTAEVTSDEPDINPENNSDSVTTLIGPAADLSITKTVSSEEVVVNNTLTYTLVITNNGPSDAANVVLTDNLPSNVIVSSITPSQGTCIQVGDMITCNLGDLEKDKTITVGIGIQPTEPGLISNSAYVSADEADPNECNNSASACAYVKKEAGTDLSVTKSHYPEPAAICTPVKYTITVTNNGPTSATGIIVSELVPASLEILSIKSSQGRCCICEEQGCHIPTENCHEKDDDHCNKKKKHCNGDTQIVCQLGALAAGAGATVEICAKPLMLGSIANTVIVTSNEEDLDPGNNEATDILSAVTIKDLIELLINYIYGLIASGLIEEEQGNVLIGYLKDAKAELCCDDTCKFEKELECFIKKVKLYIKKGTVPEEQGCYLERSARMIKKFYKCSIACETCGEPECRECGDDDRHD